MDCFISLNWETKLKRLPNPTPGPCSPKPYTRPRLQYGYLSLDVNEVYLNFSAVLPQVLAGQVGIPQSSLGEWCKYECNF